MAWTDKLTILREDITKLRVDAVVNAANSSLLGGGGVDGAIHRAAGPDLLEECKKLDGCPKGDAKITAGYRLLAPWVIHTVGPRWKGGADDEDAALARCYRSCLTLAEKCFVRSIAFPSIATGAYGFPLDRAARIAVAEIRRHLERGAPIERVIVACFDDETFAAYAHAIDEIE